MEYATQMLINGDFDMWQFSGLEVMALKMSTAPAGQVPPENRKSCFPTST